MSVGGERRGILMYMGQKGEWKGGVPSRVEQVRLTSTEVGKDVVIGYKIPN